MADASSDTIITKVWNEKDLRGGNEIATGNGQGTQVSGNDEAAGPRDNDRRDADRGANVWERALLGFYHDSRTERGRDE